MKRKAKLPKERNPFIQHMITKKCGAHGKSKKAQRRDDKISLRKGKSQDDFDKVKTFSKSSYGSVAELV